MTSGVGHDQRAGQALFCYMGPPLPGADAILAYRRHEQQRHCTIRGEPTGTATKTWVLPMSTPGCEAKITNGGWIIADERRQVDLRRQREGRRGRQHLGQRAVPGSRACAAVQPARQRARHRLQQPDLGDHLRRGDDRRVRHAQLPDRRPGSRRARQGRRSLPDAGQRLRLRRPDPEGRQRPDPQELSCREAADR